MHTMFGSIEGPVLLVLPAGPSHIADMEHAAWSERARVLLIDVRLGGSSHDLLRTSVQRALVDLCRTPGAVSSAHFATDCRSFSPLNAHLGLRPPDDPDGLACPPEFRMFIRRQNRMIELCAALATILVSTGRGFTWENPPDLDIPDGSRPWAWPAMGQRIASLWKTSWLRSLNNSFDLVLLHASMCMFGSSYRKFFGLLMPRSYHSTFASLDGRCCPKNGDHAAHVPAHGLDKDGHSSATLAGQYPWKLNLFLIQHHGKCAPSFCAPAVAHASAPRAVSPTSDAVSDSPGSDGGEPLAPSTDGTALGRQGLVSDGAALSTAIQGRIAQESDRPPGFSSYRNLLPATQSELFLTPLPSVRQMAARLAATAAAATAPQHPTRVQWDGRGNWRRLTSGAPAGNVSLLTLIGATALAAWDAYVGRYQAAFDAVRAGLPVTEPGEHLIRDVDLPQWARPFVWEASDDGLTYLPVVRSDRHSVFPGRQIDRARMREAARVLGWERVDKDICDQAFEGGCELRTHAPLHTTASWHHRGVQSHFKAADDIVRAERAEQWTRVSPVTLPYVPCTFSPRDVVMQERSKLEPSGEFTIYEKPRVTHNMSKVIRALGGRRHGVSANSAVPEAEKALPGMPTVQDYARAQAVCDLAGGIQLMPGCEERRADRRFDALVVRLSDTTAHDCVNVHRCGRQGGEDWAPPTPICDETPTSRARSLERYTRWLFSREPSAVACVAAARAQLAGRTLGCVCAPLDCHAHFLALAANCSNDELSHIYRVAAGTDGQQGLSDTLFDSSLPTVPFERPFRSQPYGIDMESAYCFLPVQRADHYANCYLWIDEEGVVRAHVSTRVTFGGSPWPQRFERVALLNCAWIERAQMAFDRRHPPPAAAQRWAQRRRELVQHGELPLELAEEQSRPAGIEPFIDDANGRALSDLVPLPPHLAHIAVGAAQTAAIGAAPAHPSSRVAVHCRIAIHESRRLGWSVADHKTMCGDGVILLGAQLDTAVNRIRCPQVKRRWITHAIELLQTGLDSAAHIDSALMARFTGRLTNLSQFFPELRLPLSVGYAMSKATWVDKSGQRRRPLASIRLRPGGRRAEELATLLAVAAEVANDDWGVPLAPSPRFPSYRAPSTLTILSDASRAERDDGVGGFAFLPTAPHVVFMLSVAWPEDIKAALDRGAERRAVRVAYPAGTPMLSLPAAEVFGSVATAAAVQVAASEHVITSVVGVGDCAPAAAALSRLYSKSAQIRHMLAESRAVAQSWMGVAVPREWNTDADRLSHPSMAADVARDAADAGLRVVWLTVPPWMFTVLRAASLLPMGTDDANWRP